MKKTERIFTKVKSVRELIALCETRGEKVLFRFRTGPSSFDAMTYGTFYRRVAATAAGLSAIGLAGKRIAVIGETSPEWVSSYLAVIAAGGVVIPMDKELDIHEIEGFLTGVEAEGIFFGSGFGEKLAAAMEHHPSLTAFFPMVPFESDCDKVLPLEALMAKGEELLASEEGYTFPERDPEEMAIMLFTSGTTGTSKCVMLCEKNLCTAINAACATVNFCPEDVVLSILPLHHTYELMCMMALIDYGATVCINDSIRNLMRNLKEFKPTGLVLVPLFINTMAKRIFDTARKQGKEEKLRRGMKLSEGLRKVGIDLRKKLFAEVTGAFGGNLCKIISGGAALNPEMVKTFGALGIQICEGYGITECSPLISVTPYYAPKRGSVGPAVPGCTVRIDGTAKNDKGFVEGEIQVLGDNVMLGYYNNEEENKKAFTAGGWYRTGDVGYMDKDGYIFITGRMKSVIVLENGKNVFPEEIEEYLASIEQIAEAVVVGRSESATDTVKLTAVVYPNKDMFPEGATAEEMHEVIYKQLMELNKKLPSFKKIQELELRDTEFEKTTSRKIKRHLIK